MLTAVKYDKVETVKVLLDNGCDLYAVNDMFQNALHLAAKEESTKMINYLIMADADRNLLREQLDRN